MPGGDLYTACGKQVLCGGVHSADADRRQGLPLAEDDPAWTDIVQHIVRRAAEVVREREGYSS